MKKNITIVLFLISLSLNSQSLFNSYEKGKITFKDGKEASGLIKISGDKIKFKKTKDDEKVKYSHKELKKIKFRFGDEFIYKTNGKSILLLNREVKGKLNLYSYEIQSPAVYTPNGMMGIGNSHTVYMIGKENSDFVEKIHHNPKNKKFKKILSRYVSDCNTFLKKIIQ